MEDGSLYIYRWRHKENGVFLVFICLVHGLCGVLSRLGIVVLIWRFYPCVCGNEPRITKGEHFPAVVPSSYSFPELIDWLIEFSHELISKIQPVVTKQKLIQK